MGAYIVHWPFIMAVIIVHFVDLTKQIKMTMERAAQALDNTNILIESSAMIRYKEDR